MAGNIPGAWDRVISTIKHLVEKEVYTTVGVVLTPTNEGDTSGIIKFAHDLGVSDIRVIPSAQHNTMPVVDVLQKILDKHPILSYRIARAKAGEKTRGISKEDSARCAIVLDDMAVIAGYHFPCIIYLREQGAPIGKVGPNMRSERETWSKTHNCHEDPICKRNCLDVCVDYNNTWAKFH